MLSWCVCRGLEVNAVPIEWVRIECTYSAFKQTCAVVNLHILAKRRTVGKGITWNSAEKALLVESTVKIPRQMWTPSHILIGSH